MDEPLLARRPTPSGVTIDAWRAGSDDRAAARWSARDAKKWTGTRHGLSRLVGTLAFYSTNATAAGNVDHFHRQGRGRREHLRLGGGRATIPLMLRTDEAARHKLTVPPHVARTLTGWAVWAVFELRKTPEEVLEAQWSCVNEELRAFTGGLLAE